MHLLWLCLDPLSVSGVHCQGESNYVVDNNSCFCLAESQYTDLLQFNKRKRRKQDYSMHSMNKTITPYSLICAACSDKSLK